MKIVLVSLFALLFSGCKGPEENDDLELKEIPVGYQGQARMNPYLAAERFLSGNGFDVQSSRTWTGPGENFRTILMPASFLTSMGLARRALQWVEEGGLLIVTAEGGDVEINDYTRSSLARGSRRDQSAGFEYLSELLGVEVGEADWEMVLNSEESGHLSRPWHLAEISINSDGVDSVYQIEFEGDLGLSGKDTTAWEAGDESMSRMVTVPHGQGQVMILSHARAFRNAYLDRADHGEFLKLLADWHGTKSMLFLYGSGISFSSLLWQNAWQVIVAGLVLLVFWLWMRIPRFGPVMDDDEAPRRVYRNELSASARFLWRKKQLHYYLRPLRNRLEAEHAGDPETLYQGLADLHGLSKGDVIEAMTTSENKDPATLTRIVQKLQTLLK